MTDTIHLVRDELRPPADPPQRRHLISIEDLTHDDVTRLLATARSERIQVELAETDGADRILLVGAPEEKS